MMISSTKLASGLALLSLATTCSLCSGSRLLKNGLEYLEQPELVWEAQTTVILDGNGIFTSPDDAISLVTQANGDIMAFDTFTGIELWSFTPPSNSGKSTNCQGGATFSTEGNSNFIVYSVIDDANGVTPFT
jgi:outer membrane protein assembly factor BamB